MRSPANQIIPTSSLCLYRYLYPLSYVIYILYSNEPQRSSPTFFKSVSLSLSVNLLRLSLPTRTQSGLCSITRWDHYATTKNFTGKSLLLCDFLVYNSGRANMECNCVSCVRIFNGVELPQCSTEPDRVTTLEKRESFRISTPTKIEILQLKTI